MPAISHYPMLLVEGSLKADNLLFRAASNVKYENAPQGIIVNLLNASEPAKAEIDNCTFEGLFIGAAAWNGGDLTVANSRFERCLSAGVLSSASATVKVSNCIFHDCRGVQVSAGKLDFKDSRIEGGGMSLSDALPGSVVANSMVSGASDIGLYLQGGVAADIKDNQFGGFKYGGYFADISGSECLVQRNVFWGNSQGGLVFDGSGSPLLRRNQVLCNSIEILNSQGREEVRPAIMILESATPDLGTENNPGLNVIRYNSPLALYHAGTSPVQAQGNIWGTPDTQRVEDMIYHQPDDGGDDDHSGFLSGTVFYQPLSSSTDIPGNSDLDWNGRIDSRDLFYFLRDWHGNGEQSP